MKTISRYEVLPLINSTKGKFFTVNFVKKDGQIRRLTARTGVRKYIKGTGKRKASTGGPVKHRTLWDSASFGYRSIILDSIVTLKINKEIYVVK